MHTKKVNFGEWITVTHYFKRIEEHYLDGSNYNRRRKVWQLHILEQPIRVIVIGKRTLSEGRTIWDSEAGYQYTPTHFLFAFLVAKDMRSKPFFIPYFEVPES